MQIKKLQLKNLIVAAFLNQNLLCRTCFVGYSEIIRIGTELDDQILDDPSSSYTFDRLMARP